MADNAPSNQIVFDPVFVPVEVKIGLTLTVRPGQPMAISAA